MHLLIISTILFTASSFTTPPAPSRLWKSGRINILSTRSVSFLSSSTRDEEIAELEAKLRQLRETDGNNQSTSDEKNVLDADDEKTLREFEAARRRLEKVKGKDMLLTEQTLIQGGLMDNSTSNDFGMIPLITAVVLSLVGLFFFAQVPIGQEDLARYSATGSSAIKTIDLGDINPDINRQ